MSEALGVAERGIGVEQFPAADVVQLGTLAVAELTMQEDPSVPLLARWAASGVTPIVGSTDMSNPDTATWRQDTEDSDT